MPTSTAAPQSKVLEPTSDDAAAAALQRVIEGFCVQLLAPEPDGRLPFASRLLHLIKVCACSRHPAGTAFLPTPCERHNHRRHRLHTHTLQLAMDTVLKVPAMPQS